VPSSTGRRSALWSDSREYLTDGGSSLDASISAGSYTFRQRARVGQFVVHEVEIQTIVIVVGHDRSEDRKCLGDFALTAAGHRARIIYKESGVEGSEEGVRIFATLMRVTGS